MKSAYCLAPDLAYGSLSSSPTLGNRWRVGVEFDAVTIDQKYRAVTPHSLILDHRDMAVVQHQPISVEPGRDHRVILFPKVVPHDEDAKVVERNPCLLESNELCDRVIFAGRGLENENSMRVVDQTGILESPRRKGVQRANEGSPARWTLTP